MGCREIESRGCRPRGGVQTADGNDDGRIYAPVSASITTSIRCRLPVVSIKVSILPMTSSSLWQIWFISVLELSTFVARSWLSVLWRFSSVFSKRRRPASSRTYESFRMVDDRIDHTADSCDHVHPRVCANDEGEGSNCDGKWKAHQPALSPSQQQCPICLGKASATQQRKWNAFGDMGRIVLSFVCVARSASCDEQLQFQ